MSEEFKFEEAPVLTLDPFPEKEEAVQVKEETAEPAWDDTILTEEERRMVDQFTSQIDLHNSNLVLQYGAGTQKKMADFSEKALENVQTKDLGEIGDLLTNVVTELSFIHRTNSSKYATQIQTANSYNPINNPAKPAHIAK